MTRCCVPGCNSGCKSCPDKRHYFQQKKNADLKKKWEEALGIMLRDSHFVCDKHFLPEEVQTERRLLSPAGNVVGISPYKLARLVPGSIPSRFLPTTENTPDKTNVSQDDTRHPDTPDPQATTTNEADGSEEGYLHSNATTGGTSDITFSDLLTYQDYRLPLNWLNFNAENQVGQQTVCFSKTITKLIKGTTRTVPLIEVLIQHDLKLTVNIVGEKLDLTSIGIGSISVDSIDKLESVLELLSSYKVCTGFDTSDTGSSSVSHEDVSGAVRHDECPLLLTNHVTCNKCRGVMRNFDLKQKRLEAEGGTYKRIRFNTKKMSSDDRRKVELTTRKVQSAKMTNTRLHSQVNDLKSDLQKAKKCLINQDTKVVEDIMDKLNVDKHQRKAVRHIMMAAKNRRKH